MRICRFDEGPGTPPRWGELRDSTGSTQVRALASAPFVPVGHVGDWLHTTAIRLLAPAEPKKVLGFGRNYAHIQRSPDEPPFFFLAPSTSLIGPGADIVLPNGVQAALPEPELALVIARRARYVSVDDALSHVLGYTCANDLTARSDDGGMYGDNPVLAKCFDTFCPLGPWLETELDPSSVRLGCRVNGEELISSTTGDMLTSAAELIAYSSRLMTLEPGDVLLTGTPKLERTVVPGDEVEVWINGVGSLTNPVRRQAPANSNVTSAPAWSVHVDPT